MAVLRTINCFAVSNIKTTKNIDIKPKQAGKNTFSKALS
jgi:hypothetical protein